MWAPLVQTRWENILFKNKFYIPSFQSTHALARLLKDRECESKMHLQSHTSSSVISWSNKISTGRMSCSLLHKIAAIDDKTAFFDVDRPTLGSRFRGGNCSVHFIYWQEQIAAVKIELDWRLTWCRLECEMEWVSCSSSKNVEEISDFYVSCFMRQKLLFLRPICPHRKAKFSLVRVCKFFFGCL